jgi:RimJ/RimL family protein N-acetyltransferase
MSVIRGSAVDVVCPFPTDRIRLVYEWTHAYSDLTENDDSPESYEMYEALMGLTFSTCTTYGMSRAGAPDELIGVLYCEPSGPRNAYLHVAMSRRAWGRGLTEEAVGLCIRDLFERYPGLTRLSAVMLERNRMAQSLAHRMGFTREATLADMVLQGGMPRNVVHFGLTRRDWERSCLEISSNRTGGNNGSSNQ